MKTIVIHNVEGNGSGLCLVQNLGRDGLERKREPELLRSGTQGHFVINSHDLEPGHGYSHCAGKFFRLMFEEGLAAFSFHGLYDFGRCFHGLRRDLHEAFLSAARARTARSGEGYTGMPCFNSADMASRV